MFIPGHSFWEITQLKLLVLLAADFSVIKLIPHPNLNSFCLSSQLGQSDYQSEPKWPQVIKYAWNSFITEKFPLSM